LQNLREGQGTSLTVQELANWINTVLKAVGKALPASFAHQTEGQIKRTMRSNQMEVSHAVRVLQVTIPV
jgi:hypothetical protein